MMACFTMKNGCTEETSAVSWKYEVSFGEPLRPSPTINYIYAPTPEEAKKKIVSAIENYIRKNPSVLVQYWAATKTGKTYVLTTTGQPFGCSGNNEELQTYRKACLNHKLYVYKDSEKEVAFSLPGRVFLHCSPEQTQNVHRYPADHRPPCDDAIFTKIWGSFAVPVIEDDKCIGVLEFVMDTPKESFKNDILVVYGALEDAGLQTSIQMDSTKRTYLQPKKTIRKSKSFDKTKYCRLAPLFGLSSDYAAEILELKPGTFTNVCRRVGIPQWPCIRNTRASSIPETKSNQMIAENSSFVTPNADLISISDKGFPAWPPEQTMTSDYDACLSELPSLDFMDDAFLNSIWDILQDDK